MKKNGDSGAETPDGCKGVQIDSSLDMQDDIVNSVDTGTKVKNTPEKKTKKQSPRPQLSTQVFNGDYLA